MEQLIKNTRKLGNASGVLLPKEWEGSLVRVELIKKPLEELELLDMLRKKIDMKEIVGVYLVGSHARGDNTDKSDIDLLVISHKTDKEIHEKGYEINIIPKEIMDEQKGYPFYYSMLKEAKPILNDFLLESYKRDLQLSRKGVKEYLSATKKNIKKSERAVKGSKSEKSNKTYDAVAYSLVLRLRGLYILDCIIKNKPISRKGLLSLIKKLTNSLDVYNRYLAVKNNEKAKLYSVNVSDADAIINYLKKGISRWERILKEEGKF